MKDLEIVFEQVEVSQEKAQMRLDKAFDIIFLEIVKAADMGSQNPQNYARAGEVSANV